jgi:hypothetical protein
MRSAGYCPLDVLLWIEPLFRQQYGEKVLRRARLVADGDGFAAQRRHAVDPGGFRAEQSEAAAVDARGEANVETLFERLEPAQRHADAGVGLAGCDRFQQLLGRTAEIDEVDVEIVLGKNPALLGDRRRCRADGGCVPGKVEVPGRAGERLGGSSGMADRSIAQRAQQAFGAVGRKRPRRAERAERGCGAERAGEQHAAGEAVCAIVAAIAIVCVMSAERSACGWMSGQYARGGAFSCRDFGNAVERRFFGLLQAVEVAAFEGVEGACGGKKLKAPAVAHHDSRLQCDAGGRRPDLDDVIVGHKISCCRSGRIVTSGRSRNAYGRRVLHAPVAVRVCRQEISR